MLKMHTCQKVHTCREITTFIMAAVVLCKVFPVSSNNHWRGLMGSFCWWQLEGGNSKRISSVSQTGWVRGAPGNNNGDWSCSWSVCRITHMSFELSESSIVVLTGWVRVRVSNVTLVSQRWKHQAWNPSWSGHHKGNGRGGSTADGRRRKEREGDDGKGLMLKSPLF